jgi:two-component system heavy metal sensor histidine kinase CusS
MRHVLPRTLRARLTILFAVSTSLLLVLSGLLLYQVLRTRLEANSAREMTSILTALQLELQEIPAIADIGANRETWYDRLHGHQSMDVAIFDVDGSPLARTNGYWPNAAVLSASVSRAPVRLEAPGSPIRFLVAMVPVGRPASAMVRVVVQYDATAQHSVCHRHRHAGGRRAHLVDDALRPASTEPVDRTSRAGVQQPPRASAAGDRNGG